MDQRPDLKGSCRKLLRRELDLYRAHLLRLDEEARRKRFAHSVSDGFIENYAQRASDAGTIVFGYFDDGELRGVGELKCDSSKSCKTAEAAFSVETPYLNRGIATELMGHIIRSARNRGVRHLVLNCLIENAKMRAIAVKYNADLRIEDGAVIADIVPKSSDYLSRATEAFDDRIGIFLAVLDLHSRSWHNAA